MTPLLSSTKLDHHHVYAVGGRQSDVVERTVLPLLDSALYGGNAMLISTGSNGSGRDYTLYGSALCTDEGAAKMGDSIVSPGLASHEPVGILYAITDILCRLSSNYGHVFGTHVRLSAYEVCGNQIYDLLSPQEVIQPFGIAVPTALSYTTHPDGSLDLHKITRVQLAHPLQVANILESIAAARASFYLLRRRASSRTLHHQGHPSSSSGGSTTASSGSSSVLTLPFALQEVIAPVPPIAPGASSAVPSSSSFSSFSSSFSSSSSTSSNSPARSHMLRLSSARPSSTSSSSSFTSSSASFSSSLQRPTSARPSSASNSATSPLLSTSSSSASQQPSSFSSPSSPLSSLDRFSGIIFQEPSHTVYEITIHLTAAHPHKSLPAFLSDPTREGSLVTAPKVYTPTINTSSTSSSPASNSISTSISTSASSASASLLHQLQQHIERDSPSKASRTGRLYLVDLAPSDATPLASQASRSAATLADCLRCIHQAGASVAAAAMAPPNSSASASSSTSSSFLVQNSVARLRSLVKTSVLTQLLSPALHECMTHALVAPGFTALFQQLQQSPQALRRSLNRSHNIAASSDVTAASGAAGTALSNPLNTLLESSFVLPPTLVTRPHVAILSHVVAIHPRFSTPSVMSPVLTTLTYSDRCVREPTPALPPHMSSAGSSSSSSSVGTGSMTGSVGSRSGISTPRGPLSTRGFGLSSPMYGGGGGGGSGGWGYEASGLSTPSGAFRFSGAVTPRGGAAGGIFGGGATPGGYLGGSINSLSSGGVGVNVSGGRAATSGATLAALLNGGLESIYGAGTNHVTDWLSFSIAASLASSLGTAASSSGAGVGSAVSQYASQTVKSSPQYSSLQPTSSPSIYSLNVQSPPTSISLSSNNNSINNNNNSSNSNSLRPSSAKRSGSTSSSTSLLGGTSTLNGHNKAGVSSGVPDSIEEGSDAGSRPASRGLIPRNKDDSRMGQTSSAANQGAPATSASSSSSLGHNASPSERIGLEPAFAGTAAIDEDEDSSPDNDNDNDNDDDNDNDNEEQSSSSSSSSSMCRLPGLRPMDLVVNIDGTQDEAVSVLAAEGMEMNMQAAAELEMAEQHIAELTDVLEETQARVADLEGENENLKREIEQVKGTLQRHQSLFGAVPPGVGAGAVGSYQNQHPQSSPVVADVDGLSEAVVPRGSSSMSAGGGHGQLSFSHTAFSSSSSSSSSGSSALSSMEQAGALATANKHILGLKERIQELEQSLANNNTTLEAAGNEKFDLLGQLQRNEQRYQVELKKLRASEAFLTNRVLELERMSGILQREGSSKVVQALQGIGAEQQARAEQKALAMRQSSAAATALSAGSSVDADVVGNAGRANESHYPPTSSEDGRERMINFTSSSSSSSSSLGSSNPSAIIAQLQTEVRNLKLQLAKAAVDARAMKDATAANVHVARAAVQRDADALRTELACTYQYVARLTWLLENMDRGEFPVSLRHGIRRFAPLPQHASAVIPTSASSSNSGSSQSSGPAVLSQLVQPDPHRVAQVAERIRSLDSLALSLAWPSSGLWTSQRWTPQASPHPPQQQQQQQDDPEASSSSASASSTAKAIDVTALMMELANLQALVRALTSERNHFKSKLAVLVAKSDARENQHREAALLSSGDGFFNATGEIHLHSGGVHGNGVGSNGANGGVRSRPGSAKIKVLFTPNVTSSLPTTTSLAPSLLQAGAAGAVPVALAKMQQRPQSARLPLPQQQQHQQQQQQQQQSGSVTYAKTKLSGLPSAPIKGMNPYPGSSVMTTMSTSTSTSTSMSARGSGIGSGSSGASNGNFAGIVRMS